MHLIREHMRTIAKAMTITLMMLAWSAYGLSVWVGMARGGDAVQASAIPQPGTFLVVVVSFIAFLMIGDNRVAEFLP